MATEKQGGAPELQIETTDNGLDHLKDVDLHDKALNTEAHQATAQEHSFGVFQALKTYKRAAFWSIRKCQCRERVLCADSFQSSRPPSSWRVTTLPS